MAAHPDALDLAFARACLLEDLGRLRAARRAYAGVVERDAVHAGALTNLATMAYVEGHYARALELYRRCVDATPDDAAAHINVANVLADSGEPAAGRAAYERALALVPAHPVAHAALALLLDESGERGAADAHRARAYAEPIAHVVPAQTASPLRVLVPYTADGGNLVTTLFFDRQTTEVTTFVAQSYRPDRPLPPHDVIVNAVADADRSAGALADVERIVAASGRPCVNSPHVVRTTGRVAVAERLRELDDVVTPHTVAFSRATLTPDALTRAGFAFPLLVRSTGYHAGRHFVRVDAPAALAAALDALPGDAFVAIAFVDTRDAGGRYRKYRMLVVGGMLLPLHVAFARSWKVHYFSADNAVRAESRRCEVAFLTDPHAHLGATAYAALERIAATLALDYGGIDFSLDANGTIVVFEANATFAIYFPADDATAVYRQPVVQQAVDAVRDLIARRALCGDETMRENRAFDQRKDLGQS